MGIYSKYIFPWLLDKFMSQSEFQQLRKLVLANVHGNILEIGFGTGLNISHYPDSVKKITAVDKNPGMIKIAKNRILRSSIKVEHYNLSAEKIPFKSNSFDTVVSTWTLCSIKNIDKAIADIYRVLKPGGKLIFLEHGLSNEKYIQKIQRFINPVNLFIGDGCHLTRNILTIIKKHPFQSVQCKEFYMNKSLKYLGYLYQGIAVKGGKQ